MPYTFSWQGRTYEHNFPSGLDDYPRAYIVNERYEIHLDLQSWMAEFSMFMRDFADYVEDKVQSAAYEYQHEQIKKELWDKLYNENNDLYCDYVGMQWEPIRSNKGVLSEPIEWREDGACGPGMENSLK